MYSYRMRGYFLLLPINRAAIFEATRKKKLLYVVDKVEQYYSENGVYIGKCGNMESFWLLLLLAFSPFPPSLTGFHQLMGEIRQGSTPYRSSHYPATIVLQ